VQAQEDRQAASVLGVPASTTYTTSAGVIAASTICRWARSRKSTGTIRSSAKSGIMPWISSGRACRRTG
jgi:hypothetical protein